MLTVFLCEADIPPPRNLASLYYIIAKMHKVTVILGPVENSSLLIGWYKVDLGLILL